MEETQTIQQMCATFGVTPRTLRFYESKELLFPKREGTQRLFTRRDSARLKLILRGKRFGFSLEEIRQMLDMYDIENGPVNQMAEAIEAARLAGLPLVIAGVVHDEDYHRRLVEPFVDGTTVSYVGPVGPAERDRLLGGAVALLHLIGETPEPDQTVANFERIVEAVTDKAARLAERLARLLEGTLEEIVEGGGDEELEPVNLG